MLVSSFVTFKLLSKRDLAQENISTEETAENSGALLNSLDTSEVTAPNTFSLQEVFDSWDKTVSGNTSTFIYDLDNNYTLATKDATKIFYSASLYKLYVVYEGYLKVVSGEWNEDDYLTGSYTISDCLDLAIRESNSVCGEALLKKIGKDADKIIEEKYFAKNTSLSNLETSALDIASLLKIYHDHPSIPEETYTKILDSMINQPPVDNGLCEGPCVWRQGLPSGFSSSLVYNKVGWSWTEDSWTVYHDAAIVVTTDKSGKTHHYIVVVLTSNLNSASSLAKLGTAIENAFLSL